MPTGAWGWSSGGVRARPLRPRWVARAGGFRGIGGVSHPGSLPSTVHGGSAQPLRGINVKGDAWIESLVQGESSPDFILHQSTLSALASETCTRAGSCWHLLAGRSLLLLHPRAQFRDLEMLDRSEHESIEMRDGEGRESVLGRVEQTHIDQLGAYWSEVVRRAAHLLRDI